MEDISGTGIEITLIAIPTFPAGLTLNAFADDTDPLDTPELQTADWGMGVNGDLVIWNTPKPIEVTLGMIPETDQEKNRALLADANRPAKGKLTTKDSVIMTVTYPDGTRKTLTSGRLVASIPLTPVASAGRFKSKPYRFIFENKL